jgi:hypothetical protein
VIVARLSYPIKLGMTVLGNFHFGGDGFCGMGCRGDLKMIGDWSLMRGFAWLV